jgi:protein-S-isoprenylcysteine O-methyltransferase Ste14
MADIEDRDRREAAIKRLKARRGFTAHAAVYVMVNILLVVVWAISGMHNFWPIWVIVGWGIGLVMHAWAVYFQPITEADIRREMERG